MSDSEGSCSSSGGSNAPAVDTSLVHDSDTPPAAAVCDRHPDDSSADGIWSASDSDAVGVSVDIRSTGVDDDVGPDVLVLAVPEFDEVVGRTMNEHVCIYLSDRCLYIGESSVVFLFRSWL